MIRFFRWLLGYVEFYFSGGFVEGFINDCYKQKININNLDRIDDGLVGFVNVRKYKLLHHIALKHGGVIRIIKRHGPIFALMKIKNRWGILAGIVAFLFIVNFLSGFVWDIEIVGNSKLTNYEIENILNANSLTVGTHWSNVKKNDIENYILSTFDDCAWVHINRNGTKAIVEINEAVEKPEIIENKDATNLKATKDGIIVEAYTHGGWQVAQVGDSVKKGDLLVSGVYESETTKTNVFAHGSGVYIAKVKENFDLVVNRKQSYKNYGKPKKYRKLVFYNLKLPLYIGKINYVNCDSSVDESYCKLNGKILPIGIITTTVTPYTNDEMVLDDNELTTLMNTEIEKKIEKEFSQYEVVSRNIDVSLTQNQAIASGYVDCLEDIGTTVKITNDD